MKFKFQNSVTIILFAAMAVSCNQKSNVNKMGLESRIDSLIHEMTLEEKVNMIHASSSFTSGGVQRLGIPELIMSDGPHGVRHEHGRDWDKETGVYDSSTYLPVGTALAATWNRELGYEFGSVLGSEANYRGKHVILGPGLNIIRDPRNGRNFEYMTEDPYLNSQMVTGYIKGVQDQDVAVSAKHYLANSLEYDREYVNVEMSDRALYEIYLPGFKAAVQEGGALTVMASYNKFRGTYVAHSNYLLNDILKEELGFEGLVMSDWNAVKGSEAVKVGMDIEMGTDLSMLRKGEEIDYGNFFMGDTIVAMVNAGVLEESIIDDKVRRILRVMHKINLFDKRKQGSYNTVEHQQVAKQIAGEAIVLLKNESLLPLQATKMKKIAVVGDNAIRKHAGAGGSSQVKAYYEITPLEGLENLLGETVEIQYAQGYLVERDSEANQKMIAEAVEAVKSSEYAIYYGGWVHGYSDDWNDNAYDAEALDKPDMMLPFGQEQLINAILDANPNTVVVLFGGGPVDMSSWKDKAKAIIQAWYPGMEGGNALASIIYGELNPSGKLPMSFPNKLEDSPAHALASYPDENLLIEHKEDIFVGYRYFDSYNVEPAFPFGHGLSYTSFEYSDLQIEKSGDKVKVSLNIKNNGSVLGGEVVQLYVQDLESSLRRPEKELKEFRKVFLESGQSEKIEFMLDKSAFSFYDDSKHEWALESGEFGLMLGSSSRDIRLEATVNW